MRREYQLPRLILGAALGLMPSPLLALSPPDPAKELTDKLEVVSEIPGDGKVEATDEAPAKKKSDLLIVPIPQSSPSLGFGITLAGALFYNPNEAKEPWITGLGLMRTSNKSWGVGAVHKMTLADDKFRISAFAGYADVNVKFFGIGPNAGDRNLSIELNEKGYAILLQGQMRIAENLYAGPRILYLDLGSSINVPEPLFPEAEIPRLELDTTLAEIGPTITYDRRDSSLNPRNGEVVTAAWMFGVKALGSDFSHNKFTLNGNIYRPLGKNTVIAARAAMCGVSKGGPFYDLCLYGSSSDLRGYETGRYRDRASWAAQVELRQHLFGRFGAVAFAGAGGVAPSLSDLDDSKFLPAAGLGVRYRPSKETNINLRVDYAVGKDSSALYISVGEAF